jgi:hypothetical protein
MPSEAVIKAAESYIREERDQFDVNRRVNRAIANDGRVIQTAEPFFRLRSPDGSVWRVKIDNAGVLTPSKES